MPDSILNSPCGREITGRDQPHHDRRGAVTYRLGDQTAGPYERTTWLSIPALPDETFTIKYGSMTAAAGTSGCSPT